MEGKKEGTVGIGKSHTVIQAWQIFGQPSTTISCPMLDWKGVGPWAGLLSVVKANPDGADMLVMYFYSRW